MAGERQQLEALARLIVEDESAVVGKMHLEIPRGGRGRHRLPSSFHSLSALEGQAALQKAIRISSDPKTKGPRGIQHMIADWRREQFGLRKYGPERRALGRGMARMSEVTLDTHTLTSHPLRKSLRGYGEDLLVPKRLVARRSAVDKVLWPLSAKLGQLEDELAILRGGDATSGLYRRRLVDKLEREMGMKSVHGRTTNEGIAKWIQEWTAGKGPLMNQKIGQMSLVSQELSRRKHLLSLARPLLKGGGMLGIMLAGLGLIGAAAPFGGDDSDT